MKYWRFAGLFLIALSGAPPCLANSAGTDPFNFLFLDANARSVGMGGAYTALATDANALLYNPAGLGQVHRYEATFMHNEYFQGITQEYLGFAAKQGWGLNINYLKFGDVTRTTIANPDGVGLGNTGLSDYAVGAGYGKAVSDSLSLGAGVKFIRESIDNVRAEGDVLDLGALYSVPLIENLTVGAAIQNIGPSVTFQSAKEKMPLNLRGGLGYRFRAFGQENTASLDVTKERVEKATLQAGVETIVAKAMPVRLGYSTRNDAGPGITAGVGWFHHDFSFDYAFVPFGDLGIAHRISLSIRWGDEANVPRRSVRSDPARGPALSSPEEHFLQAEKLIKSSSYAQAKQELTAAAAMLEPKDQRRLRYYDGMGRIALREAETNTAQSYYLEGLKLGATLGISDSTVADIYAGLGACFVAQNNAAFAVKYFDMALEFGPTRDTRRFIENERKRLGTIKSEP